MTLSVGPFQPDQLPEQRKLFRLAFPEQSGKLDSGEHYDWKFRRFPATPPAYEYAALDDGKMLGYYAALPYPYRIAGKAATSGMVCDVMTHPDARGRGIFATIGKYATDDLARHVGFLTGYPIRPEVIPGHLKVGWRVVRELPMYLRPLKSRSLLPPPLRPFSRAIDAAFGIVGRLQDRAPKRFRSEVLGIDGMLALKDYGRLAQRAQSPTVNALQKSAAFMRWRLGAPGVRYRVVAVFEEQELRALAVARSTVLEGIAVLALLDVMVDPVAFRSLGALHGRIAHVAREEGAEAIVIMCAPSAAKRLKIAGRFLRSPHVFKLIVKCLDPELCQAVEDARAWEPMWIDSDDL